MKAISSNISTGAAHSSMRASELKICDLRLTIAVLFVVLGGAPAQAQRVRVTDLLDLYLKGDFAAAVAPLARVSNVTSVAVDIEVDGDAWAAKGATPADIERRRLAAASLALEFTVLRMGDEWYTLRPLIEWGCVQLRKSPPGDRELAWQRAALAAIQGARDITFARRPMKLSGVLPGEQFAVDHVGHVALRFQSHPAVRFAEGWVAEFQVPVEGRARFIDIDTAATFSARAIDHYRAAAADPALAHEARLAIGYIQLRMKKLDAVLPELDAAAASSDPFVRYLAHLFRGRTIEQLGGTTDAIAAYRAALTAIPNTQSASIALSAMLHRADQVDPAIEIMNASFAARPAEDPWREYGFGQFRHWARYRDRMREAVR